MIDDKNPQALNILDVIQGDSYSETIDNIISISQGNIELQRLLLDFFYQNPKKEIHQNVNSALNTLNKARNKDNWICGHNGCKTASTYSHELSEKAALRPLANKKNKAFILKPNLQSNAFEFYFAPIHTRDILNFSGYCSQHDQSLFKILDKPGRAIDSEHVNLQSLRMMRRHILIYEIQLKVAKNISNEIGLVVNDYISLGKDATEIQKQADFFQDKIKSLECSLKIARLFYDKLWDGIKSNSYIVDYKNINECKPGWAFSHTFEFQLVENNDIMFFFMFKFDINGQPVLITAWDKTTLPSESESFDIPWEKIISGILLNKDKLVLSESFINSIDKHFIEMMIKNEELYSNLDNPIYLYIYKNIFFNCIGSES